MPVPAAGCRHARPRPSGARWSRPRPAAWRQACGRRSPGSSCHCSSGSSCACGNATTCARRSASLRVRWPACSTWAVPMVAMTGGVAAYRAALTSQAGEDFEGVPMLVLQPGLRRLAAALADSFLWPWGWWPLAVGMIVLALIGTLALRGRGRLATWLGLGYLPYLVYHLLLQETETTRYALPLVPLVATLVVVALLAWTPRLAARRRRRGLRARIGCVAACPSAVRRCRRHRQRGAAAHGRRGATVRDSSAGADASPGLGRDAPCPRGDRPDARVRRAASAARAGVARSDARLAGGGARVVAGRSSSRRPRRGRPARAAPAATRRLADAGRVRARRHASPRLRLVRRHAAAVGARRRLASDA